MINKIIEEEIKINNLSQWEVEKLKVHINYEYYINKLSLLKLLIDYEQIELNKEISNLSKDTNDIVYFTKIRTRNIYNDLKNTIDKRIKYLEFIDISCYIEQ